MVHPSAWRPVGATSEGDVMSEATVQQPTRASIEPVGGVGDAFVLRLDADGGTEVHCVECDYRYGPTDQDPKLAAVVSERSIADLSDLNAEGMVSRLVARHYFCPACGMLFAINVQQHGDPVMLEWSLDLPAAAEVR
jgi:acetone carboxylase gamma subunit